MFHPFLINKNIILNSEFHQFEVKIFKIINKINLNFELNDKNYLFNLNEEIKNENKNERIINFDTDNLISIFNNFEDLLTKSFIQIFDLLEHFFINNLNSII